MRPLLDHRRGRVFRAAPLRPRQVVGLVLLAVAAVLGIVAVGPVGRDDARAGRRVALRRVSSGLKAFPLNSSIQTNEMKTSSDQKMKIHHIQ